MNSMERFFTALRREEPDRVPTAELEISMKVVNALMPGATIYEFVEAMDIDGYMVFEDIDYKDVRPGVKKDHFGIERDFSDMVGLHWPIPIHGPIEREEDLAAYVPPDPHDQSRYASLREAARHWKDKRVIMFDTTVGFLYPAWLRGYEEFLIDYYVNPRLAKKLGEIVTDYYVEVINEAVANGADVILDGDDYCGKKGPVMSPALFKEFVLPDLQRVVDTAKALGVPFIKHCDGYTWPILDMMISTGIDAINPIEPAAGMDIGEVKQAYGDRVAIMGNVDCAHLLTFGTPDEVRRAVRDCIRAASPGGGHIVSCSNTIHDGVPPENYVAMLEAIREYGQYPIRA